MGHGFLAGQARGHHRLPPAGPVHESGGAAERDLPIIYLYTPQLEGMSAKLCRLRAGARRLDPPARLSLSQIRQRQLSPYGSPRSSPR